MRNLFVTKIFLKDLEREYVSYTSKQNCKKLKEELACILGRLLFDVQLEVHHKDHKLSGDWNGFKDCHVFSDLVLIYRKFDKSDNNKNYGDNALVLARIGSHSELRLK